MTAPTSSGLVVLTTDELKAIVRETLEELMSPKATSGAEPLLLTCSVLCKRLGISRATVYRAREQGLPSVKVGDEFRYEIEPCLAFFRGRSK